MPAIRPKGDTEIERVRSRANVYHVALLAVVALYVATAVGYAKATPKWNNPDEPAHFNYARQIATTLSLPILQVGDYDQAYLEKLKPLRFPDGMPVDGIRYESHQPPLYYLLAATVLKTAEGASLDGQVLLLRGFSIALGALLVILAYRVVAEALPGRPWLALGAAAFVATVPMHVAMTAAVNNDTLAEVMLAATLWLCLRGLKQGFTRRLCLVLGLALGGALLTKVTIYSGLAVALVAIFGRWQLARAVNATAASSLAGVGAALLPSEATAASATVVPTTQGALRGGTDPGAPLRVQILMVYGVAAFASLWWFARNALIYGWNDPFGLVRHDAVVVGQPRTAFTLAGLDYFLNTTFQSFWGQFGWMGVVLDRRIYQGLLALSVIACLGLALFAARRWRRRGRFVPVERWSLVLLGLVCVLAVAELLYYNLTFIQAQGRYLFPAIVPIGLFFVIGLAELLPRGLRAPGVVGLYLALLALDYVCLVRFVAPYFRGG